MQTTHSPAVPLERDIQRKIIAWLRKRPQSFTVKLAAGSYTMPGLPDILHVEHGIPYFFEVKRPGGKVTPLQAATIDTLLAAGAAAAVITGLEEAQQFLEMEGATSYEKYTDRPE